MNLEHSLQEQVTLAAADRKPLNITAGNTKSFLGRTPRGDVLDVSGHRGILSYEPKELVITARGGTPLKEIEAALADQGQMLPFEPPYFGANASLGGTIATGLSGPRRPYTGSARDFVLGVRLLNGKGEILRFGGEVMKNVAGYDISRLMSGAMGTLGVILDVSLKVLPLPAREITLVSSSDTASAIKRFNELAGRPLPLSAAACDGERSYIRLSGAQTAVDAARKTLGGDLLDDGDSFWQQRIREQGHAFFQGRTPLWRLSLPPGTAGVSFQRKCLVDWGGALRWVRSDHEPQEIFRAVAELGGHATLFRNGERNGQIYQPQPAALMTIHMRLKQAFDPQGLFNPGRLYEEF
jgi:glycolate oxidase FAD binding subunit